MTIIVSMFGFAGRFAGDLLTSALGWASSLLFGRVPRSHQIFLVLMMAWSFLWIILVLGLLVPSIESLLLASTPHPPFVDRAWLGTALLLGAIFLPLGAGLAGYFVPAESERPGGAAFVRDVLRGYLLAPLISGLLVFLAGVGIARKIRSRRHGWSDAHVPIVVKPGGYDRLVVDLQDAVASANLPTAAGDAPWVLTLPARLLTRVAGGNVRKLRPDRLVELTAPSLRIGVYPSDIAISGTSGDRTRARAAIISRLATTSAHLTTSAEAQKVEDRLGRLADRAGLSRPGALAELPAIDALLLNLAVPSDEWDILWRVRLQLERNLLAGSVPGKALPGQEAGSRDVAAVRTTTGVASGSRAARPGGASGAVASGMLRSMPISSLDLTVSPGDRP